MKGLRVLQASCEFLPMLLSAGVHHYQIDQDPLPRDCKIVGVRMLDPRVDGEIGIVFVLESEEWGPEDIPPRINPWLTDCECVPEAPPTWRDRPPQL